MNNYTKREISVQTENENTVTKPYDVSLTLEDIKKYLGHPYNNVAMMAYCCGIRYSDCVEMVSCEDRVNARS